MTDRVFCPSPHAYGPGDYASWHEWAQQMGETHDQRQCPDCGLWAIWVPKTSEPEPDLPPDLFGST